MTSSTETKTKQISARLESKDYGEFRKRLKTDGLTQQEFIRAVIREYQAGRLKLRKELRVEYHPADELHLQLQAGDGYEAESVDDLMDQLEGRKKPRRIKRKKP